MRNRPNARGPHLEEVAIPDRMATFSVDLSGLSALLKPNQDMATAISLELSCGRSKIPAYTPFIYHRIDEHPWPVSTNEHTDAVEKWRPNARQARWGASPQAVPSQSWILYQLGF